MNIWFMIPILDIGGFGALLLLLVTRLVLAKYGIQYPQSSLQITVDHVCEEARGRSVYNSLKGLTKSY